MEFHLNFWRNTAGTLWAFLCGFFFFFAFLRLTNSGESFTVVHNPLSHHLTLSVQAAGRAAWPSDLLSREVGGGYSSPLALDIKLSLPVHMSEFCSFTHRIRHCAGYSRGVWLCIFSSKSNPWVCWGFLWVQPQLSQAAHVGSRPLPGWCQGWCCSCSSTGADTGAWMVVRGSHVPPWSWGCCLSL